MKQMVKYRVKFFLGSVLAFLILLITYGGFRKFQKTDDLNDLYVWGGSVSVLCGSLLLTIALYKVIQKRNLSDMWLYLVCFVNGVMCKVCFAFVVFSFIDDSQVNIATKEAFGEALPLSLLLMLTLMFLRSGYKNLKTFKALCEEEQR